MEVSEIIRYRLQNQQLSINEKQTVAELVRHFGAFQAQDFNHSIWALGIRLKESNHAAIHAAISNKEIIRTWAFRGTLQWLDASSVRWISDLVGSRLISSNSSRFRLLELDKSTLLKSVEILQHSMKGGLQLSREEISNILRAHKITATGLRLTHILWYASLNKIICHGIKSKSESTFVLLDDWVKEQFRFTREMALAEITRLYFTSHGPATVKDFQWWSGLSITEIKTGIELNKEYLEEFSIDGKNYWMNRELRSDKANSAATFLLPGYDEYYLGYADRNASLNPGHTKMVITSNGIFHPAIVHNGLIIGTWRRTIERKKARIEIKLFNRPQKNQKQEIIFAAEKYCNFSGSHLDKIIF